MKMKILKDHISPETAYVVDDYPYGFRLRCKIRYWLEYHPKHGFRFWSQTTNPKRGNVWNKPKASTYCRFGGCMFLDDNDHVQWSGLSEYSSGTEAKAWSDKYREGVPEAGLLTLDQWVAAKLAYDGARQPDDHLAVGLPEAREAFINATRLVTKHNVEVTSSPACHPQYVMTVPAGTLCKLIDGKPVVAETSKIIGGNPFDLAHHYVWLSADDVELT
jgi:hypothetical protein